MCIKHNYIRLTALLAQCKCSAVIGQFAKTIHGCFRPESFHERMGVLHAVCQGTVANLSCSLAQSAVTGNSLHAENRGITKLVMFTTMIRASAS
jgi:hypothetical protein